MKKRIISAVLAMCVMMAILPSTALAAKEHPFADVPQSHWANEAVGYVYKNGLMNGVDTTAFQPNSSLTRAMFVVILGRMAGAEVAAGESGFTDVSEGQWYSGYVAWAAGKGIVTGTENGGFSPNNVITREQMATMIARYVESDGLTLPKTVAPADPFTDRNAVSSWAESGVELMRQTGILTGYGDGSFRPQSTANRAEAAMIFMRLAKALSSDTTPENPPLTQPNYKDFLAAKGYLNYTNDWWCTPSEYALLDIDQDGKQELIIQGEDGTGFSNCLVFRWDSAQGKVINVPLNAIDFDGISQWFSCYGGLGYSPKYKSLVFTSLRPYYIGTTAIGGCDYYTIQEGILQRERRVGPNHTDDLEIYYEVFVSDGTRTVISAEKHQEYVAERNPIEFIPLP